MMIELLHVSQGLSCTAWSYWPSIASLSSSSLPIRCLQTTPAWIGSSIKWRGLLACMFQLSNIEGPCMNRISINRGIQSAILDDAPWCEIRETNAGIQQFPHD